MSDRVNTPFTAEHFVAYCLRMVGHPYWYGTCGYKATSSLLSRKAKQYPSHYGSSRTNRYKQDIANQGGGLRLHRRREGLCLDGRRSGHAGRHRHGQVRPQHLRRTRLPGQGRELHVQLRQEQGLRLGHDGHAARGARAWR